jgi:hypothetical protein
MKRRKLDEEELDGEFDLGEALRLVDEEIK